MSVKNIIISITGVLAIFCGIVGAFFLGKNTETFKDKGNLYTKEQVDSAIDSALSEFKENDEKKNNLILQYKETIVTLNDSISQQKTNIDNLTKANRDYEILSNGLKFQVDELEETIKLLNSDKLANENTIQLLEKEIEKLENEISVLTKSEENKTIEIEQLNKQILNLQSLVSQLQTNNELNATTINSLNLQIVNLNTKISEMTSQIQNNNSIVNSLRNKITELEKSISYYEQYISGLENGTQVVATFEFNSSVYNIQILNKNDIASVKTPTSTDYVQFNYWMVNNERVNLDTYQINSNVKFIANITKRYDVKFNIDTTLYNTQLVVENSYANPPTAPTIDGYEFLGWSINGVDIVENIDSIAVIENTTYIALFAKIHAVSFLYENEILSEQNVRNGDFAKEITVENTLYKIFNGWRVDNILVDVKTYKITGAVTFIADIIYKYDAKFKIDEEIVNSQIVVKNSYATGPEDPIKNGYIFDGWTVDGNIVVNVNTYAITQNTIFIAKFTKTFEVKFMIDNNEYNFQVIKSGNKVIMPATPKKDGYIFNGWTLDGNNIIDAENYVITANTIFKAKFTKLMTWQSIYSGSNVLYFGTTNNQTTNVNGLTTTDTFRVTFSKIAFEDGYDDACNVWYYTTKNTNGKNVSFNVNDASVLTLSNGEEFIINTATSRYNAKLIVTCLENGILNISFRIVDSNDELAPTKYFGSISLTISSIEIYR